jgi:hypothetical protein
VSLQLLINILPSCITLVLLIYCTLHVLTEWGFGGGGVGSVACPKQFGISGLKLRSGNTDDCCYSLALSDVARRIWLSGCPEFETGKALIVFDKVDLSCVSVLVGRTGYDVSRRPSFQC